jgi:hypothetical protein
MAVVFDLPMKAQLSKQISIAKHIIDGSITIDSVDEFQGVLLSTNPSKMPKLKCHCRRRRSRLMCRARLLGARKFTMINEEPLLWESALRICRYK